MTAFHHDASYRVNKLNLFESRGLIRLSSYQIRSIAEVRLKFRNPINTMKDEIDSETTELRRTRIQSKSAHAKSIVEMQAVKPSSRDQSCITSDVSTAVYTRD